VIITTVTPACFRWPTCAPKRIWVCQRSLSWNWWMVSLTARCPHSHHLLQHRDVLFDRKPTSASFGQSSPSSDSAGSSLSGC